MMSDKEYNIDNMKNKLNYGFGLPQEHLAYLLLNLLMRIEYLENIIKEQQND